MGVVRLHIVHLTVPDAMTPAQARPLPFLILLAATLSTAGAAIHVAAIAGGVPWYRFFNAPAAVVASARAGTWLAPVSTAAIALAMALCAAYACSALGVLRRLPLLRPALFAIAAVCLLRAFVLPPLAIGHPELRNLFEVVAALVWGLAGVGFAAGFLATGRSAADPVAPAAA